jgi:UDP-N-acetylmuramate--alanine ligase
VGDRPGPDFVFVSPDAVLPVPRPGVTVDLSHPRHVHVVGVGGTGMTPIATVLVGMGHVLTGSDRAESANLAHLRTLGAGITVGHDPAHLDGVDVVIASSAVPAGNIELVEAARRGLPILWRSEILASICATRRTLAVTGTKGKTTTTAMLAAILTAAGWDPSYIIGGDLHGTGHGAVWRPEGEWLVVEADESDGTFLVLDVEGVVVTNVLPDHLDFYGGRPQLQEAFAYFVGRAAGPRVLGADDAGTRALAAGDDGAVTFGTSADALVRMTGVRRGRRQIGFDVAHDGVPLGRVELGVPGDHNARNACGALALALAVGVSFDVARHALGAFREVARRFEWRGERDGITFVDDYAHLPSAVQAVLATAREGRWDRIVAVFQPHRYSRTASIYADFADAFVDADVAVLTDIYAAGEAPRPGISGQLVVDAVRAAHPDADVRYVVDRAGLAARLEDILRSGDLCLTLGAGDLNLLPAELHAQPEES